MARSGRIATRLYQMPVVLVGAYRYTPCLSHEPNPAYGQPHPLWGRDE